MSFSDIALSGAAHLFALFLCIALLAGPISLYVAKVFSGERVLLSPLLAPLETFFYKMAGIRPEDEMGWGAYAKSLLFFSLGGIVLLFVLLMGQGFPRLSLDEALNVAVSFVTNTNWQAYVPETTLTAFSQMAGLAVQNFLSAAVGLAVMAALIRGFARAKCDTIGNFWADLVRGTLYVLLPLSLVLAIVLLSLGVVQGFGETISYKALDSGKPLTMVIGPVASQAAIKDIGTNGGGYYAANAAHPFENPTPLSNFIQIIALLLLPFALPLTYGRMLGKPREGKALLAAMILVFIPLTFFAFFFEGSGNPLFPVSEVSQSFGNMEGKDVRIGVIGSTLWSTVTTAASNGSVNASLDSMKPLTGLVSLLFVQFGEIIFGGVGSGLYGMVIFVLLAVFIAGLMIGRTPEYLGKKIGVFEMKMASLAILIPAFSTLFFSALAVITEAGRAGVFNPGAQGFTEILYAFTSASNNNGSAMGGLQANTIFYNLLLAFAMMAGRFGVMIPVLAIAGAMAKKTSLPSSLGTLRTDSVLFVFMLIGVILLVGVLTYVPALALGPIAEHFHLMGQG